MSFTEHASKKYVDERDALLATKNALANEAQERENVKALLDNHTKSGERHVSDEERAMWNRAADALSGGGHVSDEERTRWNSVANALQGKDVRTNTSNGLREAVKVIAIALGAASVKALAACAAAAALASGAATVSTAPLGEIDFDASVVTNVTFEGLSTPDFVVYTNGYKAGGVPVVVTNTVARLLAGYAAKMRVSPVEVPDGAAAKGVTFVDTYGEDQNQAVEMGEGASSAVSTNALLNAAPGTVARSVGVAIGAHSVVSNAANEVRSQGVAVGYHAQALASNAIAIGAGAQHPDEAATHLDVTEEVTKVGNATVARGETAIAVGYSAKATGAQSVAVGRAAEARASGSVQIGTGVNTVANSLAFRDWQLVEGDGQIPSERLVRAAEEFSGGLFQHLERLVQPGNMTVVYGGGYDQVLEPRLGGVCEVELSKGTNDVYMAGATASLEPPLGSRNYDLVVTNIPQAYWWKSVDGERTLVPVPEDKNFGLDFSELPGGIAPTLMCEPSVGYVNGRFLTLTNAPVVVKVRQPATNRVVVVAKPFRSQGGGAPEDDSAQAQMTAHAELLAMRAEGALMPGREYRITNYVATTTGDMESRSANHPFDIIVTADDERTLNEHARAIVHDGDTYFAGCDLAAWDVWYCIDNDTNRFAWADADGKGVIYRLVDEFQNDCPYDFKGIQFKAYGDTDDVYRYTFDSGDASNNTDLSKSGLDWNVYKNTISPYSVSKWKLNRIVFKGSRCHSNTFGAGCYSNTFGAGCYYNTFGSDCCFNTFGAGCYSNTFGSRCHSNTFGLNCRYNTFGSLCRSNTFGSDCHSNTFGTYCHSNTFGSYCYYNTFGAGCTSNTFGSYCTSNTFGSDCHSNTFGSYCFVGNWSNPAQQYAGTSVKYNNVLYSVLKRYRTSFVTSLTYLAGETLYYQSKYWECTTKHSGAWNAAHFTEIQLVGGILSADEYVPLSCYRYVELEDGVSYVALHSTATGRSRTNYYQNVTVTKGVLGTSAEPKLIEDANVNQVFKTTYQPAASQVIGL